jgi:hypothetical protein
MAVSSLARIDRFRTPSPVRVALAFMLEVERPAIAAYSG